MSAAIADEISEFLLSLYFKSVSKAESYTFCFIRIFYSAFCSTVYFLLDSCKVRRASVTIFFPSKLICFGGCPSGLANHLSAEVLCLA